MTKPRVYLGTIAIVPRKDIKRFIENFPADTDPRLESAFHGTLREIFALPPPPPADDIRKTDLCIDINMPGYNTGEASELHLWDLGVPLIWRPKIELRARLRRLSNRKTVKIVSITERPAWREYLSQVFFWRTVFVQRRVFDEADMEVLLNRASLRLLERIAAVAYR